MNVIITINYHGFFTEIEGVTPSCYQHQSLEEAIKFAEEWQCTYTIVNEIY